MSGKTVAVMQPTYLPWLGYFGMIESCDEFVFLDSVQFSKRSWQQRNRILINGNETFLTIPVSTKGRREQLILEAKIEKQEHFELQHLNSLHRAYGKLPFFDEMIESLEPHYKERFDGLADFTIGITTSLVKRLGILTPTVRSSDIPATGRREQLLASIVEALGGGTYLAAPGSKEYLQGSDAFEDRGIRLKYFDFTHPTYPQCAEPFVSHLSIVDSICRLGFGRVMELIREGVGGQR